MFNVGDALTQAQINGVVSLYCNLHSNTFVFDYTSDIIRSPYCDIQIKNGLYTNEELVVENTLDVEITNPIMDCCNFYLKIKYYDYSADENKNNTTPLKEGMFLIKNNRINFNKMVYIMLDDWKLVVKYNKPCITYP